MVRGDQKFSPPDYQTPDMKASQCGYERQDRFDRGTAGRKGSGKNYWFVERDIRLNLKLLS